MLDNRGDLQAKYHWAAAEDGRGTTLKAQLQLSNKPGYSMYQVESDYLGADYALNVRAVNANPSTRTGIYMASYLQAVAPSLAVGVEGVLQKPTPDVEEAGMSLVARLAMGRFQSAVPASAAAGEAAAASQPVAVATLTLQNLLGVHASYFHRLSDNVELASELQAVLAGPASEAVASVGCRLEYRASSIRAQLDSLGKLAVFVEERLMGRMALLVSGEIDHVKGRSKFGVGLSIEN